MSQRSLAFVERIQEFPNECDQQDFTKAHDAMKDLLESIYSGGNKAVVQGMWTAFGTEHRTHQQSCVRAIVEMLQIFGGCEKERACDARNEASYDFARSLVQQDGLFFPYI